MNRPWYIRKFVRMGPVRWNLSKSGIGCQLGFVDSGLVQDHAAHTWLEDEAAYILGNHYAVTPEQLNELKEPSQRSQ